MFTTTAICIYFASLTLICKLLFIRRISLDTKISILNSQMLAFWGTPFILTIKILKAKLQTFHSAIIGIGADNLPLYVASIISYLICLRSHRGNSRHGH